MAITLKEVLDFMPKSTAFRIDDIATVDEIGDNLNDICSVLAPDIGIYQTLMRTNPTNVFLQKMHHDTDKSNVEGFVFDPNGNIEFNQISDVSRKLVIGGLLAVKNESIYRFFETHKNNIENFFSATEEQRNQQEEENAQKLEGLALYKELKESRKENKEREKDRLYELIENKEISKKEGKIQLQQWENINPVPTKPIFVSSERANISSFKRQYGLEENFGPNEWLARFSIELMKDGWIILKKREIHFKSFSLPKIEATYDELLNLKTKLDDINTDTFLKKEPEPIQNMNEKFIQYFSLNEEIIVPNLWSDEETVSIERPLTELTGTNVQMLIFSGIGTIQLPNENVEGDYYYFIKGTTAKIKVEEGGSWIENEINVMHRVDMINYEHAFQHGLIDVDDE
jgi:hypothetical protein